MTRYPQLRRQEVVHRSGRLGGLRLSHRRTEARRDADVVHDRVTADPRDAVLLVVGDLDCSGEDIERHWVARPYPSGHPGLWTGDV
ncbi:hypothetical protein [Streptomyces sp. NPDC047725]|uniref:hypothetical protein n=1 Tax=Streptomyces sp. NPDC047725 TaxID=3365487 RepID=UPI00371B2E7A